MSLIIGWQGWKTRKQAAYLLQDFTLAGTVTRSRAWDSDNHWCKKLSLVIKNHILILTSNFLLFSLIFSILPCLRNRPTIWSIAYQPTWQMSCTTSTSNNNLNAMLLCRWRIWKHQLRSPMCWHYSNLQLLIMKIKQNFQNQADWQIPKGILDRDNITSWGTPNMLSIRAASFITGRSESEPIIIPTRGGTAFADNGGKSCT